MAFDVKDMRFVKNTCPIYLLSTMSKPFPKIIHEPISMTRIHDIICLLEYYHDKQ